VANNAVNVDCTEPDPLRALLLAIDSTNFVIWGQRSDVRQRDQRSIRQLRRQ